MTGYTRILLPLDGSAVSEQAISYVAALAARLSVPVRLLMAVEPDSPAITQSLNSNGDGSILPAPARTWQRNICRTLPPASLTRE